MPLHNVQRFLIENAGFRQRFGDLVLRSVAQQFEALVPDDSIAKLPGVDWHYMLFCASVLAHSSSEAMLDAALRIAQACITDREANPLQRDSAAIILDQLANRPAIALAESRQLVQAGIASRLPTMAMLDWHRREMMQMVTLAGEQTIHTNAFQRAFWTAASKFQWVSASAPTSAGKSYIIEQYLVDILSADTDAVVVYLVPTRALIHQVERDIRKCVATSGVDPVHVSTLPVSDAYVFGERNVFVFTQERLHIFLASLSAVPVVDLLIVDEAQKIGDGTRGVLLQQAIERVVEGNHECQVLLSSPMTRNPGLLLEDAPDGVSRFPLDTDAVTVNQNLLWLSQQPGRPKEWHVDLCREEAQRRIGTIALQHTPTPESKRLPFVAHAMCGNEGGAMVYVNGAAAAEKAAEQLYDLLTEPASHTPERLALDELIELVKASIHDDYALAHVLKRGVGFHYGNLPLLVRDEIERLFRQGNIKYLCCTSTLIEGVNLPCKNIFVRGPKKGNGNPMKAEDFWNLAGRAGRWGKEFDGNVVCVDATKEGVWSGTAPSSRTRFEIKRSTDEVLRQPSDFVEFLRGGAPMASLSEHPEWESVVSYLVSSRLKYGTLADAPWTSRLDSALRLELEQAIDPICEGLQVEDSVVFKNPGISPIAMNTLLNHFTNYEGDPDELLLVEPGSDDAVNRYASLFATLNQHFVPEFGDSTRQIALAIIVVRWMRGDSLKRIIEGRLANRQRRGMRINLPAEIRKTMADVEQIARFHAPKYLSCYADVLRQHLTAIGREDLAAQLPDVSVLLEFGVSAKTPLSLMGMGLSRTSAIALFEVIANEDMAVEECKAWLREYEVSASSLPALVRREIQTLKESLE